MAALRAGTFHDFANSMAAYIDEAMRAEWADAKGTPLPAGLGADDRKILFAAIAQGVLKYLHHHLAADIVTNTRDGGSHAHRLLFTVEAYQSELDWLGGA